MTTEFKQNRITFRKVDDNGMVRQNVVKVEKTNHYYLSVSPWYEAKIEWQGIPWHKLHLISLGNDLPMHYIANGDYYWEKKEFESLRNQLFNDYSEDYLRDLKTSIMKPYFEKMQKYVEDHPDLQSEGDSLEYQEAQLEWIAFKSRVSKEIEENCTFSKTPLALTEGVAWHECVLKALALLEEHNGEIIWLTPEPVYVEDSQWIELEGYGKLPCTFESGEDGSLEVDTGDYQFTLFANSESAGEAAREYWKDMAENDPKEFACIVGEKTLVNWALGSSDGPGNTKVRSLDEWLDIWLDTPEEHFARYDGKKLEVIDICDEYRDSHALVYNVAYRNN